MIYVGIDPSLESSALFLFDTQTNDYAYHSFFVTHEGKLTKKQKTAIAALTERNVMVHQFADLVDRKRVKDARLRSDINTKKQADDVCQAIKDILNEGSSIDELSKVLDDAHQADIEIFKKISENDLCRFRTMKQISRLIADVIKQFSNAHSCKELEIAIEAPAYVATGSSSVDLIAGCAFIRDVPNLLHDEGMVVNNSYALPPTSVKKHATGRGTATKEEMCEAFTRKGPDDAFRDLISSLRIDEIKNYKPMDDIVDAYFMAYTIADDLLSQLS